MSQKYRDVSSKAGALMVVVFWATQSAVMHFAYRPKGRIKALGKAEGNMRHNWFAFDAGYPCPIPDFDHVTTQCNAGQCLA